MTGSEPWVHWGALTSSLVCPSFCRRLLRETTGRDNVLIAVTEFNGHFVQEKPVHYRHTLGNALLNAEMLRVFLNLRNRILMANFWQFCNEYWGAVKGYVHLQEQLVKRLQYYPFELYHHHFGDELLEVSVECPRFKVEGGYGVAPVRGKGHLGGLVGAPIKPANQWSVQPVAVVQQRLDGGVLEVEFEGEDVNYYHARVVLPAKPNTLYCLRGWVKTESLISSRGACFQIGDARGWLATRSAAITPEVTSTPVCYREPQGAQESLCDAGEQTSKVTSEVRRTGAGLCSP